MLFSYWSWGTLKVTDSHVQCTSGNISETVQESDVFTNRKWYIAYLTAPFQITLSDFQGHLPITSLLRGIFRIVVQQLKRFNLYCVARFLCKGWASCYIYLTFLCFFMSSMFFCFINVVKTCGYWKTHLEALSKQQQWILVFFSESIKFA